MGKDANFTEIFATGSPNLDASQSQLLDLTLCQVVVRISTGTSGIKNWACR